MIALIDYRAGNLTSVRKGFAAAGAQVFTPAAASELRDCAGIVVPGVGHFGATGYLDDGWRREIMDAIGRGTPVLGICLGLQWLFDGSEEAPLPGYGALRRLVHAAAAERQGAARRLELARSDAAVAAARGRRRRHADVLHALVRGAGDRRLRRGDDARSAVRGGGRARHYLGRAVSPREIRRRRHPDPGQLHAGLRRRQEVTPMLSKRIIACLDVRDGSVVKGINFEGLRRAGDPAALAERYNAEGIDELVILDVTATIEGRRALEATIREVSSRLFIPLAVGGGIRSEADAAAAIDAGADKVSLNSAALADPSLVTTLATRYGSQAVVVAIDAKQNGDRFDVYARSGKVAADRDAVEWAVEAESRGAGEILLTSIDRDGTRAGFDCPLTAAVSSAVSIPVIASGGAGTFEHFFDVFTGGRADAALAASIFHYSEHAVSDLKHFLPGSGVPVRQQ